MASIQDVLNFLFGGSDSGGDADDELVAATVEAIVDQVEPRVRMDSGYQKKLSAGVRHTLAHLRSLGRELPADPMLLTRNAWGQDARVNAFFATADDVPACLGRSRELRTLFQNAGTDAAEAYALLAMKLEERQIFAPKLVGGQLHQDVAQTSVSFTGHRLFAPALTLAETRREVGRRLFVRLAQVALRRIVEADERAVDLDQRKGYLKTRLRLLNLAKDGMEGIVQDPATIDEQIRAVQRELKDTVDEYIEVKSSIATLDRYVDRIREVLQQPEAHLDIAHRPLHVNRMGIKVERGEDEAAHDLALDELRLGELRIVIALVRCPRAEMPPVEDLVAKAERYL
jgi:hypothetical protein